MKPFNPNAAYQPIRAACRITGLSQYHLRNGCRAGTIPHILCGQAYYIHMPSLLAMLESAALDGRVFV